MSPIIPETGYAVDSTYRIDGHWRAYECYKAKGDFQRAMPHARDTLEMAEQGGGFDPSFPASIKKDIARFEQAIATATPGN